MEIGQRVRIKKTALIKVEGGFILPLGDEVGYSLRAEFGYLEQKDPDNPNNWWVRVNSGEYNEAILTIAEGDLEPVEKQEGRENYFDLPLLDRVGIALSGFPAVFAGGSFSGLIENAAERERSIATIAAITYATPGEVISFYQAHHFSLEFIEQAVRFGAKLNEEDIKRTMEGRAKYITNSGWFPEGWPTLNELETFSAVTVGQAGPTMELHAFIVTTPDGDRTPPIKAADCYINEGALCFEDENDIPIMIFAPGHWVKVERVEEEQSQNPT
jgi:hypothetical protein